MSLNQSQLVSPVGIAYWAVSRLGIQDLFGWWENAYLYCQSHFAIDIAYP